MTMRRPTHTTPDLFSAKPTARAPESLAVPEGKAEPENLASQPRHFLPKDLAGALKRLSETEIDTLLAAVTAEAGGRKTSARYKATTQPCARRRWRRFVDNGQAQCSARGVQGGRQAFRDCAAVRDFTVRRQKGARHRGAGPETLALIASQINQFQPLIARINAGERSH